jgi:hypothetical protein
MHKFNRIILILIVAILCSLGYVLYDVLFLGSGWLKHTVDLGSAFTVLFVLLITDVVHRITKKINAPSLVFASSVIVLIAAVFIWPHIVFSVWNYIGLLLWLFIGQNLLLLTTKSGSINKLLILCMTLLMVVVFLFKIETRILYSIALWLNVITTFSCCFSIIRSRN